MKRALLVALFALTAFAQDPPVAPPPPATDVEEEFTKAVFFGKKFADLGEYESAQEQYAKADALKPDQPAVLYNHAVVLARAGRYSDAQVKVDRYLQLFPEGAEKANVAKLQLELEFQRELQKKRQADQEYADLFNRAKFTYTRGELVEALRLFQRAEQVRPSDPASVYNQAIVLEKQGELAKAIERYRRYVELEADLDVKASIDERVFTLQREVDDMATKHLCSFCGRKLNAGATWCERCWHGPYAHSPCANGASATRATFFSDQRFNKNEELACPWDGESLRYTAARQRAIQEARKAEGWTYQGDVLQGNRELQYHQGPEYLEKVTSNTGGEILTYLAHVSGNQWLLDREDFVIDATRYVNQYTYDASGRIVQQRVDYQNAAACNHLVSMTADAAYNGDTLSSITIKGGYDGFVPEGSPQVDWQANVAYTYDDKRRVTTEDLTVTSFTKTYTQKAIDSLRDEINRLYPGMRVKKPIENVQRTGDLCLTSLSNLIDLRPFYALTPSLAMQLPNGVTKATVTFTYPP